MVLGDAGAVDESEHTGDAQIDGVILTAPHRVRYEHRAHDRSY